MYKIVYWCRIKKKYVYVCVRYGIKKSKAKAYEMMEEKQKQLRKELTYDGNDKVKVNDENTSE